MELTAVIEIGTFSLMTAHSGSTSVYERDGQILRGELPAEAARS